MELANLPCPLDLHLDLDLDQRLFLLVIAIKPLSLFPTKQRVAPGPLFLAMPTGTSALPGSLSVLGCSWPTSPAPLTLIWKIATWKEG